MRRFARALRLPLALAGALAATPSTAAAQQAEPPAARSLILLIADGAGTAHWTLARMARGDALAVATMPVMGLVDTRNVAGKLTDSAAAGTALATGHRSFNRGISLSPECAAGEGEAVPDCDPLETLLEAAEARGKATGLVTTTRVTDATPAAFAAHTRNRYDHPGIAAQMLASGVDVLLGGGRVAFDGRQRGSTDLLTELCRSADCPGSFAELAALPASSRRLVGLLADEDLPAAPVRGGSLADLTRAALGRLALDPDGFFLLVETEGTDTESHANRDLDAVTAEMVDFDRAVAEARAFAARHPGTLVVAAADHETGGAAVDDVAGAPVLRYLTGEHTYALVPLFAAGPGADRLAGVRDNDEVGRILRELLLGEARQPRPSR